MSNSINIEDGVEESTPLSLEEIVIQTEELFQQELQKILLESAIKENESSLPF